MSVWWRVPLMVQGTSVCVDIVSMRGAVTTNTTVTATCSRVCRMLFDLQQSL